MGEPAVAGSSVDYGKLLHRRRVGCNWRPASLRSSLSAQTNSRMSLRLDGRRGESSHGRRALGDDAGEDASSTCPRLTTTLGDLARPVDQAQEL